MIDMLEFQDVGPASRLKIDFRSRMNFLTGDNGLGKSFVLDAAWWALTNTWAGGETIRPHRPPSNPRINFGIDMHGPHLFVYRSYYDRAREQWSAKSSRAPFPALVLYARADGGFAIWDPARNHWNDGDDDRPAAYDFTAAEVWDGLPLNAPEKLCNGLIADWATWQLEAGSAFGQLRTVLRALSPSADEPLTPGELTRISLRDARKHPTLIMPYGQQVPLVHASAGIRRVVALAYLLVWAWQEHREACALRGDAPAREIIFLVDEVEAHLHPQWQRRIIPALVDVMEALTGTTDVPVQLLAATHSPLVLASLEPHFDDARDVIWEFDLVDHDVELHEFPWRRLGDINAWLTSSVFELDKPTSVPAEGAMRAALALFVQDTPEAAEVERVDQMLRESLSDADRFWVRWTQFRRDLEPKS